MSDCIYCGASVDGWNDGTEVHDACLGRLREEFTKLRHQVRSTALDITELRQELIAVLDVAIARGVKLGYEDADYHERYVALTGATWEESE